MPLHKLAEEIGSLTCKVLPAVLALILQANMVLNQLYLTEFGQDHVGVEKVDEYLVQVLKPGTLIKTMNELRFHMYHHTKKSLSDLPPTSRATRSHIQRAFYGTYIFLHCLTGSSLDAKCHGFYSDDGLIKAVKEIVQFAHVGYVRLIDVHAELLMFHAALTMFVSLSTHVKIQMLFCNVQYR